MKQLHEQLGLFPPSHMYPNLWVGCSIASTDKEFLEKNHIDMIINCTKDLPFSQIPLVHYRVPVNDDLSLESEEDMLGYLDGVTEAIYEALNQTQRILIHCHSGKQRSATVFLAWHMRYVSQSFEESYHLTRQLRPVSFQPSMNFFGSIRRWLKQPELKR